MDKQPGEFDRRRPAYPSVTAAGKPRPQPLVAKAAATLPRFEVARVLRRSLDIVRSRWLELLVLAVLLGWALPQLIWLVARSNLRDLTSGFGTAARIGAGLIYSFAQATIMAAALRGRGEPIFSSISRVIRSLPVLIPVWVLSDIDTAWRLWASWAGLTGAGSLDQRLAIMLAPAALEWFLVLIATVAVGVFYPIVLEEGRDLLGAMTRAWRLMHGVRWRFFGLFLLWTAMVLSISLLFVIAIDLRAGRAILGVVSSVAYGLSIAVGSLWSVVTTASFIELRSVKEGPPHDQAAGVFA